MIEFLLGRNRLTFFVPMSFIAAYETVSWGEALWGCRRSIINHQAIIELAAARIATDPSPQQALIDLSQLTQEHEAEIEETAEKLARDEQPTDKQDIETKWLRISLAWLIANWRELPNAPGILENLVSDFGYPDSLHPANRAVAGAAGSSTDFNSDAVLVLLKQCFIDQGMPLPPQA
jgi:hypothetical protein